jgi:hypothetical protein
MHCLARIGLAALGLALAAPTVGWAQQNDVSPGAEMKPTPNGPQHRHRRTLFGREILCPDCQRAKVKAEDGVDIPPPPPLPSPDSVVQEGRCEHCEQAGAVASGPVVSGPMRPGPVVSSPRVVQGNDAPGHAVVGGDAPGHAVVGGDPIVAAEPSPIGLAQSRVAAVGASRPAAGRPGKGPSDRAVMPSGFTPIAPPESNRPHIIEHAFGLSAIGRRAREERERRAREKHASIAYDQKEPKVTELPASMVDGGR